MQEKWNMRMRNILLFLSGMDKPVTLNDIADTLQVSSKTIRRDLVEMDTILAAYGAKICRKAGQGIWLEADSATKVQLNQAVADGKYFGGYTQKERRTLIVSRLLQNQEPVKLFEFTSLLKVSEATVSKDLDKLEGWFADRRLKLIRRPGLGVYVSGAEKDIRKAIVYYIYENINEEQLIGMLHDTLAEKETDERSIAVTSSRRLLNLVNTEIIQKLEEAVLQAAQSLNCRLSDRSVIGLVVHLALAVQRMQKNEKIVMDEAFLGNLKKSREFLISSRIAKSLEALFAIRVPESEIGYITMHVLGARNQLGDAGILPVNKFKLVCLARKMIQAVEKYVGCELMGNDKLLIGLVNHLAPSISRIQLHMEIRNPLLNEMREKYAELMIVSQQAAALLEEELKLRLPEQEIAYLAMHFGAAIEEARLHECRKRYRVAIACPTGVGSSRLLASRVRREFERLEVVCTISALRLERESLMRDKIDFILSTMPIGSAPLETVQVSSLLTEADKTAIWAVVQRLDRRQMLPSQDRELDFLEQLKKIRHYNDAAAAILEHFFLEEITAYTTIPELIEMVSVLTAADKIAQKQIADSLRCREEINSTVLSEQQIMFLHCETAGIDRPYFGVIRAAGGIRQVNHLDGENVSVAVVMLLPADCNSQTREIMGVLTETIAERLSFSQSIQYDDAFHIRQKVEKKIREFYMEKNKMLLEEG